MFDMVNIIVLRPFGSDDYIFIRYDRSKITTLEQLRSKITWKHLESLDDSYKNEDLKEEEGKFREHLQLSYQHKRILVSDYLKYILPQDPVVKSQDLFINVFLDGFVG